MKPLVLQMQAFGPFAGHESINFAELGENPLFLINGPTGAGKSSILDAICFALYGKTTGDEREGAQMRCDHSPADLLTEVSFQFSLNQKVYRVLRRPQQERSKARGEGTTSQNAEAFLYTYLIGQEGESERLLISKKVRAVDEEIEKIIGLGVDQFRQVMVLPQGKFRDLLIADSKKREEIFSQLFETYIYKRIENALADRAGSVRKRMDDHRSHIGGILASADLTTEEALSIRVAEIKPAVDTALLQKQSAQNNLDVATAALNNGVQLQEKFTQLSESKTSLAQSNAKDEDVQLITLKITQASAASALIPLLDNADNEVARLQAIQTELTVAIEEAKVTEATQKVEQDKLQRAKNNAQRRDSVISEIQQLTQLQETHAALEGIQRSVNQKQLFTTEAEQALTEVKARINSLTESLAQCKADFQQSQVGIDERVAITEKLSQLQGLKTQLQKRDKIADAVSVKNMEYQCAEERFELAKHAFAEARKVRQSLEFNWHTQQAAVLARELEDEKPCPVCGSCDHPVPAQIQTNTMPVSKDEVANARSEEDHAGAELNKYSTERETISVSLKDLKHQLQDIHETLADNADKTVENIDSLLNEATAANENMKKRQLMAETLVKTMAEHEENLLVLQQQLTGANDSYQKAEKELLVERAHLESELQRIPPQYQSIEAVSNAMARCKQDLHTLDKQLSDQQQKYDGAVSAKIKADEKVTSLEAQLTAQRTVLASAQKKWVDALSQSIFSDKEGVLAARMSQPEQQQLVQQVESYKRRQAELKGVIQALEGQLVNLQQPDVATLRDVCQQAETEFTQCDSLYNEINRQYLNLVDIQKQLEKAHETAAALHKEYAVYGTLHEVAAGNNGQKISLQRFVLSVLLDDVLIQASTRLTLMSQGRYRLLRKEDRAKGNRASGLDLEVEDAHTGKTRAAATLSGGESFMAALALALGLSDVVQAYAGGIRLDTLFIDEGFGSLDNEALDAAIKVLIDLQSAGRTIGLISHVTELKSQMSKRIDVLRTATGSSIKVASMH